MTDKVLGHATAYGYYKAGGGTMTEAEFTEFMADFGTASQTAVEAAQAALASKNAAQTAATTATNKASEATTAATTATTKAGEASTSASTATSAKDTAVSASQTATTKATEATTAAATATSAKTDAVAANTAAQSAKTAAQTAQTGAETAAASVQSSAAQIATNTEDISQLKSELTLFTGNTSFAYTKDESVSNNEIPTQAYEANWESVVVECTAGDVFYVKGWGGNSTRLWMFGKSDGTVITQSDAALHTNDLIPIVAPENTKYLCVNSQYTQTKGVLIGNSLLRDDIDILSITRTTFSDVKNIVGFSKTNLFGNIGTTEGYYINSNNGKLNSLDTYSATDFFTVISGATYDLPYHSSGSQIAFYTKDKSYVSGSLTIGNIIVVPNNDQIVYARWCGETTERSRWELYLRPLTEENVKYITTEEGILAGMIDAYSTNATKIVVKSGAYDIIAEYEAKYGADYFNNYADNYNGHVNGKFDCGIWLDNIDISFESGAIVNANYTGNNQYVKSYFSAFAIGQNVTLDGLVLDASELRYGLHPDFHAKQTEKLTIKNCDLHHYKSSDSGVNNNQAIGAGLGVYSIWEIENCIFRSDTSNPVLRIHNNASENAMSKILIKDCYIVGNGYILLNSYSTSTKQTNALVAGCSWENPAVVGKETQSSNDNITMYAWNNEIRS